MNDVVITANAADDEPTFTTSGLIAFRPETGVLTIEPGWYRVDRPVTITGTMVIEGGSMTLTNAGVRAKPRQDEPKQEPPRPPPGLPADSRPPRLVRLLSWLRRPSTGRGGPPSGEPVAGL